MSDYDARVLYLLI